VLEGILADVERLQYSANNREQIDGRDRGH
jgi:hypothetical protein